MQGCISGKRLKYFTSAFFVNTFFWDRYHEQACITLFFASVLVGFSTLILTSTAAEKPRGNESLSGFIFQNGQPSVQARRTSARRLRRVGKATWTSSGYSTDGTYAYYLGAGVRNAFFAVPTRIGLCLYVVGRHVDRTPRLGRFGYSSNATTMYSGLFEYGQPFIRETATRRFCGKMLPGATEDVITMVPVGWHNYAISLDTRESLSKASFYVDGVQV